MSLQRGQKPVEYYKDPVGVHHPIWYEFDDTWHAVGDTGEPDFENSWGNEGSPYESLSYRKDMSGYVHFKGVVSGGVINTCIFTLPSDYRPANRRLFAVASEDTSYRLCVYQDGRVFLIS